MQLYVKRVKWRNKVARRITSLDFTILSTIAVWPKSRLGMVFRNHPTVQVGGTSFFMFILPERKVRINILDLGLSLIENISNLLVDSDMKFILVSIRPNTMEPTRW